MTKELPTETISDRLFPHYERISSIEEEVFARLIPKFKAQRIKMADFEDLYSEEEVARDEKSIEMMRGIAESNDSPLHKRAQILEAILAEQIELSEWFGENAMTIIPAEFDDFHHGIDLAIEFADDDDTQPSVIGIDATTSSGLSLLTKQILVSGKISSGESTKMKYFESERFPNSRGRMPGIPSLVIGVDARTINELASLWLTVDKSKTASPDMDPIDREELRERAREAQQKLAHHRVQVLILREIELQFESFIQLAQSKGHTTIASNFTKLLLIVKDILSKKRISKADEIANDSDDVHKAIRANLEKHF